MTTNRTLRTSVPAETYTAIEHLARVLNISVAEAARFAIAFGLAAIKAAAEKGDE